MAESTKQVIVTKTSFDCPKCNGTLVPTGICLTSYPAQYPHRCTNRNCSESDTFYKQYPVISYEDAPEDTITISKSDLEALVKELVKSEIVNNLILTNELSTDTSYESSGRYCSVKLETKLTFDGEVIHEDYTSGSFYTGSD